MCGYISIVVDGACVRGCRELGSVQLLQYAGQHETVGRRGSVMIRWGRIRGGGEDR
jgi:hypothetical protein